MIDGTSAPRVLRSALWALLTLTAATAAQDIGFEGPGFAGVTPNPPTESKPESKLWYQGGSWWGSLWSETAAAFHIHRRDADTDTWIDTGVEIETRTDSKSDCLAVGSKLYVASHEFTTGAGGPGDPILFLSFTFDAGTQSYALDPGFPVQIADSSTESLVIDRDSTGTIWAVWMQELRVHYTHTMGSDDSWATPAILPTNTTDVNKDDVCSVIAFGGDRIGVMWSDQVSFNIRFSVHLDGAPAATWAAAEDAAANEADDHINLAAHSDGRVFASVKNAADEILLLVRSTGGTWSRFVVGAPGDNLTRPIVVLNEETDMVHVFATGQSVNDIFEKVSPISSISFPSGSGTPVMRDADNQSINNPTSTKQNFGAASGLVVLASNEVTEQYWHHVIPASAGLTAMFSASPMSGQAPLDVQFSDMTIGSPTAWSWDFGDGGTSTEQNPLHTYAFAGTFTVSLMVSDGNDDDTLTVPDLIHVAAVGAPVAAFGAQPTSGVAPLQVAFTDQSTGQINSYAWDFGDGGSSSAQSPGHTYTNPGTYTVSLTVSGPGGSDTETKVDLIQVDMAPGGGAMTLSPFSPGIAGTANTMTVVGATPHSVVGFLYSLKTGTAKIVRPNCPAGVQLGLSTSFRLMGVAHVDANGVATLTVSIPLAAQGHTFHFQAVDQVACEASNLVSQGF